MVIRYRPQFRRRGNKTWSSFGGNKSYGDKKLAQKFVKKTRAIYRKAGKYGQGRFRIKEINV